MRNFTAPVVLQSKEGQWVVLGLVALVIVYYVGKNVLGAAGKAAGAVADTAGGVLTGNNALTQGTDYQGAGILGTAGAATDAISGGTLSSIGSAIGGWFSDLTNPYDPNAPAGATATGTTRSQVVTPNYVSDVSELGVSGDGGWN